MKRTPLQQALACIYPKRTTLNILRHGLCDGDFYVTDLDHHLKIRPDHQIPSGPHLFNLSLYIKSGNLEAAINAASEKDTNDFPVWPELKKETVVKGELPANLTDFIPAVSSDETRETLHFIFINKGETVATDGHILFLEKNGLIRDDTLFISPVAAKIFKILGLPKTIRKDEKHILFAGDNWKFVSKQYEGEYPNYKRILPDIPVNFSWNSADISALREFIDKSKPFFPKTGILFFTGKYVVCKNRELSYFDKMERAYFKFSEGRTLAFNAFRLLNVFDFLKNEQVAVYIGKDSLSACMFKQRNRQAVLMPLRTSQDNKGIPPEELLEAENKI